MRDRAIHIPTSPSESITLYDLQRMVRTSLESRFDAPLWVSAEISELKVNRSGHCYLNLVEKGTTDGAPRAEARAVIWRSAYADISTTFAQATGAALSAGIRVLIRVVVSYHEVYGFSLQIIDLDPSYTLGEVERRRRETIERLKGEGVWDMNRELSMPRPTLRIAIVSSATAAGYRDFMRELHRAPYRFSTTLFESLMQGDAAEESVISALERIAEEEEHFDVAVIIRGGGSTSDLALFDSYRIAAHVAQFPLPIISGIGHDKDISVVDLVAHTMCKTPTAVATLLAEMVDREATLLDAMATDISVLAERTLNAESLRMQRFMSDVALRAGEAIHRELRKLDTLQGAITTHAMSVVNLEQQRLTEAERLVDSYSIDNILKLGFAVLRNSEGRTPRLHEMNIGERLYIEVEEGTMDVTVENIEIKR